MNATIEIIHQVLGNLVRTNILQETYVDDSDPWMGILAAAAFAVQSAYHRTQVNIPGYLVFGRDMIHPINHGGDWRYIHQPKQAQIERYVVQKNSTIIDHDCIVGDKFTLRKKSV